MVESMGISVISDSWAKITGVMERWRDKVMVFQFPNIPRSASLFSLETLNP